MLWHARKSVLEVRRRLIKKFLHAHRPRFRELDAEGGEGGGFCIGGGGEVVVVIIVVDVVGEWGQGGVEGR